MLHGELEKLKRIVERCRCRKHSSFKKSQSSSAVCLLLGLRQHTYEEPIAAREGFLKPELLPNSCRSNFHSMGTPCGGLSLPAQSL